MPESEWTDYTVRMKKDPNFPHHGTDIEFNGCRYIRQDKIDGLIEALETVNNAFHKGKFDKFGRYRPTKAEGEAIWFAVTRALTVYRQRGKLNDK